jgi:hypothetical protein
VRAGRIEQWEANGRAERPRLRKSVCEFVEEWRGVMRAVRIEQRESNGSARLPGLQKAVSESVEE